MNRMKKGALEWLTFDLLSHYSVAHGVFLRKGGVSSGVFDSLNGLYGIGDKEENVTENRMRMIDALQVGGIASIKKAAHGKEVEIVHRKEEEFHGIDGLLTKKENIGLLITHADCQAAIFYDPVSHALANVHAGWRGQMQNIYRETVFQMGKRFGSKPRDLIVCISPSLGPEHAEFKNYSEEICKEYWHFQVKPTYFNLWEIAKYQLLQLGLLEKNIEIACLDTYANEDDFFSYRREKAKKREGIVTGCHATVAALV